MGSFSEFKAPKVALNRIAAEAKNFREKYWNKSEPIDILKILEFDLQIRIIAVPNLQNVSNTSAFITSDWQQLYIDHHQFMDERYDYRTRFSVAHEIGHSILHREVYESLNIDSLEAMYDFVDKCPEPEWYHLENQAHAFAGRVLVPRDELQRVLTVQLIRVKTGETSPDFVIRNLGKVFQVSEDVIKRRIIAEQITIDRETLEPT